eukprot:86161-Prorocentrum_minimum.AAC.1
MHTTDLLTHLHMLHVTAHPCLLTLLPDAAGGGCQRADRDSHRAGRRAPIRVPHAADEASLRARLTAALPGSGGGGR